jgi:hypothetical protein
MLEDIKRKLWATADTERFLAWRTIDRVTLDPLGQFNELQTLIRGVLDPSTCWTTCVSSCSSRTTARW